MLETLTFGSSILALLIAIIAFMVGNNENKVLRYGVGGIFLLITFVCGLLAIVLLYMGDEQDIASVTPTNAPALVIATNTPPLPTQVSSTPVSATTATTPPITTNESPASPAIDMDTILANIVAGQGGIEVAAPWWQALDWFGSAGGDIRTFSPHDHPGKQGCYGIAWNVLQLNRTVVVFETLQVLDFQPGGTYVLICFAQGITLTAEQAGAIQAEWLSEEAGGSWLVQRLD